MQLWLSQAKRVDAWQDGGSMVGGPPRVIWHSTENDPHKTSAYAIAEYLQRVGYQVHLIWNPVSGEIVQMIPADRAGRGVRHTDSMQTNRMGDVCIQIEVVAHAAAPFTEYGMYGLPDIMKWVRGLGVPDVWPGGPPPAYPNVKHVSDTTWTTKAGHYSHSQVPQNDHNDPGAIDIKKLFGGTVTTPGPKPKPAPDPGGEKPPRPKPGGGLTLATLAAAVDQVDKKLDRVIAKLGA